MEKEQVEKPKFFPIPTLTQTVKEFIEEELSKPQYEGLTIEEIRTKPEYEEVRMHPNFIAMEEREKASQPNPKAEGQVADEADKPSPLKVIEPEVDETMLEKMTMESMMPDTPEPSMPSIFEPEYKVVEADIVGNIELEGVSDYLKVKTMGMEDLFNTVKADYSSAFGRKCFIHAQKYSPIYKIKPTPTNGNAFIKPSEHALKPLLPLHETTLEFDEVEEANVLNEAEARDFMRGRLEDAGNRLIAAHEAGSAFEAPFKRAFFLSRRGLSPAVRDDRRLTYKNMIMNPRRIEFLLQGIDAHKYTHMTFDEYVRPESGIIRREKANFIRETTGPNRDYIDQEMLKVNVYPRPRVDDNERIDPAINYYKSVANAFVLPDGNLDIGNALLTPETGSSLRTRSLQKAETLMAGLIDGGRMLSTIGMVPPQTLASMNKILPSTATTCMKKLGSWLLGGCGHELTVSREEMDSESSMITGMSCLAHLLLLDFSYVSSSTAIALFSGLLKPFSVREDINMPNDVMQLGYQSAAIELERAIRANAGANQQRNAMTDAVINRLHIKNVFELRMAGRGLSTQIKTALKTVIRTACTQRFGKLVGTPIYNPTNFQNDGDVFSPFFQHVDGEDGIDVFDQIRSGRRAHDFMSDDFLYLRTTDSIVESMGAYTRALSELPGVGRSFNAYFRAQFTNRRHLVAGMASLNDALMRGVDHMDILSPVPGIAVEESLTGHAVELPLTGALSFILYGISSNNIENEGTDYATFKQMGSIKTLSVYPMYVYLERAVCDETFAYFDVPQEVLPFNVGARKPSYIHRKRSEVKQLIKDVLQIWFKTLDPETDKRIEEYLRRRMMNKQDQLRPVPPSLKRFSQMIEEFRNGIEPSDNGVRDGIDGVARGRGWYDNGNIRPVIANGRERYLPYAIDVAKNIYRGDVYLKIDGGIDRLTVHSFRDTLVDVHCLEGIPEEALDLGSVLDGAENAFDTTMTVSMLQAACRAYVRRNPAMRDVKYVKISDVDTNIVYKELTGPTDVVDTSFELSVEYKNYDREMKFKVNELTVYYRKNSNEFRRDVQDAGNNSDFITVPFGITLDKLMERFVYFHDEKYTNKNFMMGQFTMYHMNGHILADRVGVATREVEDILVNTELTLKRSYV
jgi:hypothetical protein